MLAAALCLAAYLLWPLPSSPGWDVPVDAAHLAGKQRYLADLAARDTPVTGPNVLLILADDLGRDELGDPAGLTPSIEALSRDGVTFTNAYATAAISATARARSSSPMTTTLPPDA